MFVYGKKCSCVRNMPVLVDIQGVQYLNEN